MVMLHFLQSICSADGTFPEDLMGRMKDFCEGNPDLKAATKVSPRCRAVLCVCLSVHYLYCYRSYLPNSATSIEFSTILYSYSSQIY